MKLNKKYLEDLLGFSQKIVKASSEITLGYFKAGGIKAKLKKDNSPVTAADLKCEKFMLEQIKAKYPQHNIFSEENGRHDTGSEFTWIIDPIDGTKNFMRGYPFWGTLLAVEYQGEVVTGIISMPAIDTFIHGSKGKGCWINGKRYKVSKISELEKAYLLHGGIEYIKERYYADNFLNLVSECAYTRGFGDCHGHSFIISGMAEILVDPIVAPYDIAATKICVEEAGGILTDVHGVSSVYNKSAVITNGLLHNTVLEILNS